MHERLRPAAVLSLLGYAVGLPVAFLVVLWRHRQSIIADQVLKVAGKGGSEATNPYFHIRMQFQELYRCVGILSLRTPLICPICPRTVLLSSLCPWLCSGAGIVCSLFRPELYWWRLVLVARKFCIVGVALMFSSTPLFQAW